MSASWDVLVVGGGPAGMALALKLRRHTALTVAVVERTAYEAPRLGETLSPGARGLLDYLGVGASFGEDGHLAAYGTAAAWGGPGLATRDFLLSPFGSGWHLDRRKFDAGLAAAAESAGAPVWRRTRVREARRAPDGWEVVLDRSGGERGERHTARFLVDASGKAMALGRRLGGDRRVLDRQVAVYAHVLPRDATPIETLTMVEACEVGWWYSVRLPAAALPGDAGPQASSRAEPWLVALFSDPDLVRARGLAHPARWREALAAMPHTAARVSDGEPLSVPRVVAAHSAHLARAGGDGWLAVGDAAASHDPLSSSGIVRALDSGCHGARAIHAWLTRGDRELLAEQANRYLQAYDQYAATWARYYQLEQRWPEAPYWRRRQRFVTLDPRGWLRRRAGDAATATSLPADLGHLDAATLLGLCDPPRPAFEVVAEHRDRSPGPVQDLEVILGLQWLLQRGALELVAPA